MRLLHEYLPTAWHWFLFILEIVAAGGALLHVIMRKNDPRAAGYWVALIALVPLLGALLYLLLGINIVHRSGKRYREVVGSTADRASAYMPHLLPEWETEVQSMPGVVNSLKTLSRLALVGGNSVEPLHNGDEAMPAMLEAIESAQHSISLISYIFESKGVGARFVDALDRAVKRGVEVCVMVDDAGTRYDWPPITGVLRKRGVRAQRFMPRTLLNRLLTMNLRNHRKLLIVDGAEGFTGGMNIRQGNMLLENPPSPVADLHFRVRGPVVSQLQRVFAEDWHFCTGEWLQGPKWYPELDMPGEVSAVGLPDGPDDDTQCISLAIATALDTAKRDVRIMTPYFLPPEPIFSALISCALRGVRVRIITPSGGANNIPFVHWASRTMYAPFLRHGVRLFESGAPFDHSKLLTIDGIFAMIGSTNLDPRSLKLNFEFNLACFDDQLAQRLNTSFDQKLALSTEVTMATLAAQTRLERFRNGIARLFTPLL
jgi:cardiolipin synthase